MLQTIVKNNIDDLAKKLTEDFFSNYEDKILCKISSCYEEPEKFKEFLKIKSEDYFNKNEFVFNTIKENLTCFSLIDREGFLIFRMWKYKEYLTNISKEVYTDYLSFIQYEKMISLMKVIIKNSEPIVFNLHIDINKNKFYEIYDDHYNDITYICLKNFVEEYSEYQFNKNDFLLNTILNLSPKIITLHNCKRVENNEFIKTLKKLYEDNLIFC